jgi:NAD+ kinase
MNRVGLVVHPDRDAAGACAVELERWFADHGVAAERADAREVGEEPFVTAFAKGLDLVVSVGGDGTFLRAAHLASHADAPVLGVKVGRMGFLTEVEPHEAPDVLGRVLDGTATIEERLAVVAEPDGDGFEPEWALNEVILEKSARHRLIRLAVYVGDVYVTTFSADGVIAATPTGSTAYSFSAGGPIVSPSVPCIVVTPIAAHMVFDRSLVLSHDERVSLEVLGEEAGLLTADGRGSVELPVGTRVRLGAAPRPSRFVRRADAPAFHELVRGKFGLPGRDGRPGDGP